MYKFVCRNGITQCSVLRCFNQMRVMDWLYTFCRWILGGIFIYAGTTKLLDPMVFATMIDAYGIAPDSLVMPVAITLPLLEVMAGIGLLFDIRGSLALIVGMLVLFVAILWYAIWAGLDIDCGCFGPEDIETKAFHGLRLSLFRDMVMLGGAGFIYGWRWFRDICPVGTMGVVNALFNKRYL